MAVFTKLEQWQIEEFLKSYNLGKLNKFSEIIEGIENTNYKLICDGKPYILTIFEKRVKEEDLPFFINLKLYLNKNGFNCPKPLKSNNGKIINDLANKKAVIITFIDGNKVLKTNLSQCFEVGKMVGELHNITKNFSEKRENSLDVKEWKRLIDKSINKDPEFKEIINELYKEIDFLKNSWPNNLPSGIIHADLFKDNIFFDGEKITGVIDFYFSCYHFFIYDLCIVINDLCFKNKGTIFDQNLLRVIINGYEVKRNLEHIEFNHLNVVLRIAAVRILVTRIHDYVFHPDNAVVVKKDPFEYYNILKWHQINKKVDL